MLVPLLLHPVLPHQEEEDFVALSFGHLKDLARAGFRASEYQVLLYLAAAGEASVEEVMEELGFKRAWAYRALSPLARRGLVEKVNGRYRLSPTLEGLFAPLRRPQGEGVSESG